MPKALGNGDDPAGNLYWGAAFGVRTYFKKSSDWTEIAIVHLPKPMILERCIFLHPRSGTYLVADAYRGREIKTAIEDFLRAAAGHAEEISFSTRDAAPVTLPGPNLAVYVGHDGLMDFELSQTFEGDQGNREAIVLACASKTYFANALRSTGATPILWTTGLMAPEAYTVKAALDEWIAGRPPEVMRRSAAAAYAQYQRVSPRATERLFAFGW